MSWMSTCHSVWLPQHARRAMLQLLLLHPVQPPRAEHPVHAQAAPVLQEAPVHRVSVLHVLRGLLRVHPAGHAARACGKCALYIILFVCSDYRNSLLFYQTLLPFEGRGDALSISHRCSQPLVSLQFQYCRSVCDCQLITDDNVIVANPGNGTAVDQCVGGLNDGKACCEYPCFS